MHTFDGSMLPIAHHERLHLVHGVDWHLLMCVCVCVCVCVCLMTSHNVRWLHLGQGVDGHLVLGIIGQVLIQIGQGIRVLAELRVHHPQLVPCRLLPALQPPSCEQANHPPWC